MNTYYLLLVLVLTLMLGCNSKSIPLLRNPKSITPPNGYRVDSLTFIDKTEISNIDWKEYMYWTGKIFGKESSEYKAILLDTSVWLDAIDIDTFLMENYFKHPGFDFFPVVGITRQQAIDFSKWRSDRVFQMMLVESGIIKPNSEKENRNNHFTIKRYFAGEYLGYKPDSSIQYVPIYDLPTTDEIFAIYEYIKEENKSILENARKSERKICSVNQNIYVSKLTQDYYLRHFQCPLQYNSWDCQNISIFNVHHLIGNVAEWVQDTNSAYGGSWEDVIVDDELRIRPEEKLKSAAIGFRNICKWEKVNSRK